MKYSWDRQEKESVQSYEAFEIYRDLGSKRSLKLVAEKLGKTTSCMQKWSIKYGWVKRVYEYECYLDKMALAERERQIQKSLKRHATIGEEYQEKAWQALEELTKLDFKSMNPLQLIKSIDIGIELERKALGIASVGEEIRLQQSQIRLEMAQEVHQDKRGDNLEDSSGFIEAFEKMAENIWGDENK